MYKLDTLLRKAKCYDEDKRDLMRLVLAVCDSYTYTMTSKSALEQLFFTKMLDSFNESDMEKKIRPMDNTLMTRIFVFAFEDSTFNGIGIFGEPFFDNQIKFLRYKD